MNEVRKGHHLTTAVVHEPQSPVCFPTTNPFRRISFIYTRGTFLIIFPGYHIPIIPRYQINIGRILIIICVVLDVASFFLLVDIQHNQFPRRFFVLDRSSVVTALQHGKLRCTR